MAAASDRRQFTAGLLTAARIVQFGLNAAGDAIATVKVLDQNPSLAPEPTIGTVDGNRFVYVANSLWDEFDDNGKQIAGRSLARPRLIAVELP